MQSQIEKILIANRGEIACRIIKACRDKGIVSAAVYTDADRTWLARDQADEAVWIGEGPASCSYLDFDRIIDAAKCIGADAIHPGYGFLAENAGFARRCHEEGITFIGPQPEVIELMGNKAKAKALVASLDIPVIPGIDGFHIRDCDIGIVEKEVGFPLMIKAVSGGGGVGMRIVWKQEDFLTDLASVRREAKAAFGDDKVIVERFFSNVRHIEVQVMADKYGRAVHCFERECSIQRRRQKVIEEAPSVSVPDIVREKLFEASLKIVKAVNYVGVGTVEFVVVQKDGSEEPDFYFLEMNTRLQVEHGVTEEATGLDLVAHQIEIAEGEGLNLEQSDLRIIGHAIECRLCAEQPEKDFRPSNGVLSVWDLPSERVARIDTGVRAQTVVSSHYDSLLAKVVTVGNTRDEAIRRMKLALRHTVAAGIHTNQCLLLRIIASSEFATGQFDTGFLERGIGNLLFEDRHLYRNEACLIAAYRIANSNIKYLSPGQGGAFRRSFRFEVCGNDAEVILQSDGAGNYTAFIDGQSYRLEHLPGRKLDRFSINGVEKNYTVLEQADRLAVFMPGLGVIEVHPAYKKNKKGRIDDSNGYLADLAGVVTSVGASPGSTVKQGDALVIIESMKMEHVIEAHSDGIIQDVLVEPGVSVQAGAQLLVMGTSPQSNFNSGG